MKYTIEVEADELGDVVNLLREITRLVRESRIVSGREVQYCMGAYRVIEGDGVWAQLADRDKRLAELEAKNEKLRAVADLCFGFNCCSGDSVQQTPELVKALCALCALGDE